MIKCYAFIAPVIGGTLDDSLVYKILDSLFIDPYSSKYLFIIFLKPTFYTYILYLVHLFHTGTKLLPCGCFEQFYGQNSLDLIHS